MAIYTKVKLEREAPESMVRLSEANTKKSFSAKRKVFLSHSHLDKDLVQAAFGLLSRVGGDIYVDWADGEMPQSCSPLTAQKIKERIKKLGKVVLLASERSLDSNWVPWELGYADGQIGVPNIAVLAFTRGSTDWTRNEYVGLYPIIQDDQFIRTANGDFMLLSTWLAM